MKTPQEVQQLRDEDEAGRWSKVVEQLMAWAMRPLANGDVWIPCPFDPCGFTEVEITRRLEAAGWSIKWNQPTTVRAVMTPKELK